MAKVLKEHVERFKPKKRTKGRKTRPDGYQRRKPRK